MNPERQRLYRTDAVVLRRHDFGEADRVLTLFSPSLGKYRAVAKGVRRPKSRLGGHVELFTHVNVLVARGRNLDIVTQAETVRPFPGIRDDLWKAAYASYAAELVDRFTEERQENEALFALLLQTFGSIDQLPAVAEPGVVREDATTGTASASMSLCVRNFEVQLLRHSGYAPELYHCTVCTQRLTPGAHRFSPAEGGVLCDTCADLKPGARQISVNGIKALRLMNAEPFGVYRRLRLTDAVAQEVESTLRSHVTHILERQLKTSEFLDRMHADYRREARQASASA